MIFRGFITIGLVLVLNGTLTAAGDHQVRSLASPAACPDSKPSDDGECSALEPGETCEYGELCCDGACVTETYCYCDGFSGKFQCYDAGLTLPCPSECPITPPKTNDSCDINSRYQCNYGDNIICDVPGYSFDFEQQCSCYNGTFYCYSNVCPVPCPVTQPENGDACSAPFVNFVCEYGKFCCGDETDGACVTEKNCYCDGSTTTCYDNGNALLCPSACPDNPPNTNDLCALDSRYQCQYGDKIECDDSEYVFDYEKQCSCYNGTFYCFSNACPVPCPKTQPSEGDNCSPFVEFSCNFGEFCCPDGGGCVTDKTCYCDGSDLKLVCYNNTVNCPSACPDNKPIDGSACVISDRIYCQYATGECPFFSSDYPDATCSCILGKFSCYSGCFAYDTGIDGGGGGGVSAPSGPIFDKEPSVEIFVEESASPSNAPTEAPSLTVIKPNGKNGKKKDKTKKKKARKLGNHMK